MEDLAHGEGYGVDEERDQLEKILTLSREKLVEAEGDIERLQLGMGKVCVVLYFLWVVFDSALIDEG
jgi:hypothetical protein